MFIRLIRRLSRGFGLLPRVRGFEKLERRLRGAGVVGEDVIVVLFLCDFATVVVLDGALALNALSNRSSIWPVV